MGGALIAAPTLLLVNPIFVPLPILIANILVSALASKREWSAVHRHDLTYILAGRLAGTIPALMILSLLSQKAFDITFSALIFAAVLLSLIGIAIPINRLSLFLAGSLSGLMGTISSIGGPPTALVYKQVAGPRFRATMSMQLLIGGLISVIGIILTTSFSHAQMAASIVLLPGVIGGYYVSKLGLKHVNHKAINTFVLLASMISALLVIIRAVI